MSEQANEPRSIDAEVNAEVAPEVEKEFGALLVEMAIKSEVESVNGGESVSKSGNKRGS